MSEVIFRCQVFPRAPEDKVPEREFEDYGKNGPDDSGQEKRSFVWGLEPIDKNAGNQNDESGADKHARLPCPQVTEDRYQQQRAPDAVDKFDRDQHDPDCDDPKQEPQASLRLGETNQQLPQPDQFRFRIL